MTLGPRSATGGRVLVAAGGAAAADALAAAGMRRGDLLGLAASTAGGAGTRTTGDPVAAAECTSGRSAGDPVVVVATGELGVVCAAADVAEIERRLAPRWVLWSTADAGALLRAGVALGRAWHVGAVHRILHGGWRCDPMRVWCSVAALPLAGAPIAGQLDLHGAGEDGDPLSPVRPDGYLRADWIDGAWAASASAAAGCAWAALAVEVARHQQTALAALAVGGDALALARAESTSELLCAELTAEGLPLHLPSAEALIAALVGPRARTEAEAAAARAARDAAVLAHVPGSTTDLRNPADVKALLRRVGIELDDTRAWRLETVRDRHPVVEALLQWRKAERIATTYGYGWLDQHVRVTGGGPLGRLCGEWSGSDGAAGRMTATAGLHNLPAELRAAVLAEPGHLFVRADLGQIEPRVLAVVSGDPALVQATQADDLYAPVAAQLQVDRPTAKVAVLAAMYGQTSGAAGEARRRMDIAYPVAMAFLEQAAQAGTEGRDVRTFGGRLVRMYDIDEEGRGEQRSAAAARGRYARNAMVQGAAAELFKVWAVTVRARAAALGARIVLCLHDELLIHCPQDAADDVAQLVSDCLAEAAHRWQRGAGVRFVADVGVVHSWADAKS